MVRRGTGIPHADDRRVEREYNEFFSAFLNDVLRQLALMC